MPCTTRVLIADSSLATLNEVSAQLRAAGSLALIEMSPARIRDRARAERPDVVIVGQGFAHEELDSAVRELRLDQVTYGIPLMLAGRSIHKADIGDALEDRIDGVVALPILPEELRAKLTATARLKVMRAEWLRRKVTYGRYGIDGFAVLDLPKVHRRSILLVHPDGVEGAGGEALEIVSTALDHSERIELDRAIDVLLEHRHDAAVIFGAADDDSMLDLCAAIRRHSTLFHLPVIYLVPATGGALRARAFAQGASDVLCMPFEPISVRRALDLSTRQAMMRDRLQSAYRSDVHPETNDPVTGLFSLEFLHKHLELLIEDASRWNRRLSVITCIVPELVALRHDMGRQAGAALQRTLAGLVSRLIRGEDLCASLGDHSFCIVTPESALEATIPIMDRLRGVIGHTEFGVPDVTHAIRLRAECGSAEFRPGDTIESLLGRAHDMALRAA